MTGPGPRPRVLLVSRGPYRLPLDPGLERRFAALSRVLEWRQLAAADGRGAVGDPRFALHARFPIRRLDGLAYHGLLPLRIARELRAFAPDAVLVQGAQETALALAGRRLARSPAAIVLEVHGDWRVPTRLYGSRLRRLVAPLGDALARLALRHADAVRTVTPYTTALVREAGIEPAGEFAAYMDLETFTHDPIVAPPSAPTALYVGALEPNKGTDVLVAAWRAVAARVPGSALHVVGSGSLEPLVARLEVELAANVRWDRELSPAGVARALDRASCLVLPSLSEGMGRVVVEAFCRGRCVVGSRVGGIPDLVSDGDNGLLVPPGDAPALAAAIERVLNDGKLAAHLSLQAGADAARWQTTPDEWAARMRSLVDAAVSRARRP